jgi:hypothetical protein
LRTADREPGKDWQWSQQGAGEGERRHELVKNPKVLGAGQETNRVVGGAGAQRQERQQKTLTSKRGGGGDAQRWAVIPI